MKKKVAPSSQIGFRENKMLVLFLFSLGLVAFVFTGVVRN